MNLYLSLLRALIPTWSFFDDFGAETRVYFRYGTSPNKFGHWQTMFAPQPRKPWHLLVNVAGNERLLAVATFDCLISESQEYIEGPEEFALTPTYQICRALVQNQVPSEALYYQFKITAVLSDDQSIQDAFTSKIHEVQR